LRAAIYSRFSTDKQTESSIADQVRVCTERAEKDGHTITDRFEDQGISGAAIGNRPGFRASNR
jgi:DNA invertase Pin-like site-specific DNA recombinase